MTYLKNVLLEASRSSVKVTPEIMSTRRTLPSWLARIGVKFGSHAAIGSPLATFLPSFTLMTEPATMRYSSTGWSASLRMRIEPLPLTATWVPPLISTQVRSTKETLPPCLALTSGDFSCATPPMWNVRMVSWVPGSPMDWAAMMPTAVPRSTRRPVEGSRP